MTGRLHRERASVLGLIVVVVFMLPSCFRDTSIHERTDSSALRDTSIHDRTGSSASPPAGETCVLDKAKSWVLLQCDGDETRSVDLWHVDGWLHQPEGKLAALSLEARIDSWQWVERACGSGGRPPETSAIPLVLKLTASGFADSGPIHMAGTLLRAMATLEIGAEVEQTGLQVRYVRSSRSCEAFGGVALRVPGTRVEHRIEFGLYGVAPIPSGVDG